MHGGEERRQFHAPLLGCLHPQRRAERRDVMHKPSPSAWCVAGVGWTQTATRTGWRVSWPWGDRAGHAGGWGELRISAQGLQRKWSRPHTHHRPLCASSTGRTSQDQQTPFCVWEYFKGLDPKFRLKPVVSRKARALSPFPDED